jgi:dynein heavy chain
MYRNTIKSLLEKCFYETCMYIEENYEKFLKIYWENQRIDYQIFKNEKLFSPAESIQYSLEVLVHQK